MNDHETVNIFGTEDGSASCSVIVCAHSVSALSLDIRTVVGTPMLSPLRLTLGRVAW